MNEELLKVIRQLKDEILFILTSYNMADETHAKRAMERINELFDKLGIVIEDVIPPVILQSYMTGTAGAVLGASLYAVTELTDNVMLDLKAAIRTAKLNTNKSIRKALSEVQSELQSGVASAAKKRKVTEKVAESFAEHGMTSFVTSDGKNLPLDFYSEVVTRTNMQNAENRGRVDWFEDNGKDLVIINGVTPTCRHCYAHRGVVFSISGKDKRFPPLTKERTPPYHPNCMCYVEEYKEAELDDRYVEADIERSKNFNPEEDRRPDNIKKAYDKKQASNRKNNYEKKAYARMVAALGDEAPATLGAFKRMKRGQTPKYKELQKMMREVDTVGEET
ncbi:phage minor capsid protein [Sporosarcina sp. FSL K6-3508]|uniref:phage minor capsid protein n=1 Tax=Sporosarcina sp. FSL K6-3508 TaxID=2921557 RepID=UPI003159A4A5